MRTCLLYFFIVLCGFTVQTNPVSAVKWVVMSGGSLKVVGSTNVNNFSCVISNYSKPDTIKVSQRNHQSVKLNGALKLAVKNFDCHNKPMTDELRKILKSNKFPYLIIRFTSINQYPDAFLKHKKIKGTVNIELAGVSKTFEVDYKVISAENTYIHLVGSQVVNFTDFNITPPKKLGGMIRTNNKLSVEFNVRMKVIH